MMASLAKLVVCCMILLCGHVYGDHHTKDECNSVAAAQASRRFSYAMFRRVVDMEPENNIFLSPIVVGMALSMIQTGAVGPTKEQIYRGLKLSRTNGFSESDIPCLLKMYNLNKDDMDDTNSPLILKTASRLFGGQSFPFNSTFLETTSSYGAEMELMDFLSQPEDARQRINQWVSDQTEDKIKELFASGTIGSETVLAVVSAIYFKGSWRTPFTKAYTREGPFQIDYETSVTVDYMSVESDFRSLSSDVLNARMVELPYEHENSSYEASMILIQPMADATLQSVVDKITELDLTSKNGAITKLLQQTKWDINIVMPKFKIEAEYVLKPLLKKMGIGHMFDSGRADLSGMVDSGRFVGPSLYVSDGIHKTFIEVDEEGTVAAGAGGFGISLTSLPPTIRFNKPFISIIYEKKTNAVLFIGKIYDPSK